MKPSKLKEGENLTSAGRRTKEICFFREYGRLQMLISAHGDESDDLILLAFGDDVPGLPERVADAIHAELADASGSVTTSATSA